MSSSTGLPTRTQVCLYDWWLVRPDEGSDGKAVAVAGSTSQKTQSAQKPVRLFKSAPIAKLYDFSTLETSDGVCVILKGCINKSCTTDNGFSEVLNNFALGFPFDWEECASRCLEKRADAHAGVNLESLPSVPNENNGKGQKKNTDTNSASKRTSSSKTKATFEGTPFTSPDSFNRSRSGRILLPRLEFWRNQVAVYDANREVAGIIDGQIFTPQSRALGHIVFAKSKVLKAMGLHRSVELGIRSSR
ncbi:hypothetical protein MLD38_024959 [Melastoma candidum]|uniref:Uncharacterized protein n=1 Tax=Melastoma candidum TaxID=119954 RepID=A0ACB9NXD2_9MYRT|nr:hypothetical protein MLD38_024959 [Melastoma candidum]